MNYADFSSLLSKADSPVVLLEGTRELPASQAPALTALAAQLARTFPHLRFRTGNAKGSDEAFAAGVASVDASRIEFVLPYAGHRSGHRPSESPSTAIDDMSSAGVQEVVNATLEASPQYQRVAANYHERKMHPRQRATAQLLLRDTLKVTGTGTGHTMRVCRAQGVPVINQFHWLAWPF